MKRVVFLLLVVVFACKSEKEKQSGTNNLDATESHFELVKKFIPVDMPKWRKSGVDVEPTNDVVINQIVFHLKRNTNSGSAYYASTPISVTYLNRYRISILVKKGENSSVFGLRISGEYPDRADAIYDLEKGIVIAQSAFRDFENPIAVIESLEDGWFKCMLTADVAADEVRIIIGATDKQRNISSWEGQTETMGDIYFTPASIMFEELVSN